MYRFNAQSQSRRKLNFFKDIEKKTLKFILKHKRPRQVKPFSTVTTKQQKLQEVSHAKFQTALQSHSNKNSMVFARKYTHKPMVQHRQEKENRNYLTPFSYLCALNFLLSHFCSTQRFKYYIDKEWEERTALSHSSFQWNCFRFFSV